MFVDAAAITAVLSTEPEADRCAAALENAAQPFTSPIAVWEAVRALSRPDKFADATKAEMAVRRLLEYRNIELRQLPPPQEASELSLEAFARYGAGHHRLNLADCFHYACARHYGAAMLSTADEFRFTDLETVP